MLYGVIPLFHVFGLNVVLGAALHAGATLLLVQRFDPITAVESIRRGVTVIPGAPAMWSAFSQLDEIPADAFAGSPRFHSGAAKLSVGVMERCVSASAWWCEGYGLTEASPAVTTSVDIDPKPGSVGVLLPGMELRVVDDSGVDVLVGDAGEIWLRGPNLFAGYLDDPATTARVLGSDGWLRTGDIGYLDEDGYLFLVDRSGSGDRLGLQRLSCRGRRRCSALLVSPTPVWSACTRTPARRCGRSSSRSRRCSTRRV